MAKGKSKSNTVVLTEHGKNEGDNPHWAYQPPPDCVVVDSQVDAGEFGWETLQEDEDLELWLVRAPEDVSDNCPHLIFGGSFCP
jgi:hypothetical protein